MQNRLIEFYLKSSCLTTSKYSKGDFDDVLMISIFPRKGGFGKTTLKLDSFTTQIVSTKQPH